MNTKKSDFTGIFGSILRIPEISTKIRGTTGIQKSLLEPDEKSHTIDDVINEMRGLQRTQYIKDYWDCEDRALFAISRARCKFPCMPIGLAIGYCTSAIQGLHALVVVWSKDLTKGEFYDPELRETLGFNPEVIIPFPCDGTKRPEGIPYASNLPFLPRGGAFVLDSTYDFSKEKIASARENFSKIKDLRNVKKVIRHAQKRLSGNAIAFPTESCLGISAAKQRKKCLERQLALPLASGRINTWESCSCGMIQA